MLGTYAAALVVCGSSLLIGGALLAVCGWRRWSWLAPVVGLGPALAVAWGAVQLPGEGVTALALLLAASAVSAAVLVGRVEGVGEAVREGAPVALVTLAAASIPFAVEGRFGILGTGFNVDMSQHLFAAQWLAEPQGAEPGLVKQGYPMGPHGLAVAAAQPGGGNLVHGFGGLTIAVPVIAALASLTVLRGVGLWRRVVCAALVALPYIVASYLAQGQFKELLEGLFLIGFALCLHELARGWAGEGAPRTRALAAVPLAVMALGALYSYSAPGLAWLGAAATLFVAAEVLRRRRAPGIGATVRAAATPVAVGAVVLVLGAAPELGRVADFQGNAARVADVRERDQRGARDADRRGGGEPARRSGEPGSRRAAPEERGGAPRFNDDLGNLFGHISPLAALGIWPSGDFRVQPGDGEAPAVAFYAGAAIGALALLLGLIGGVRRCELAVPAALVAAVAIYLAARAVSTPYAGAKAVMMIAPVAMLVSVRELVAMRLLRSPAVAALAAAFVVGAAGSSLLALAKAPVGPSEYSPGLAELRSELEGEPTLVLADPDALANEHARDFLAWEARGADPLCIEEYPGEEPGPGHRLRPRYVVTTAGERTPPFPGLTLERAEGPYTLWLDRRADNGSVAPGPPGNPTDCSPVAPALLSAPDGPRSRG